MAIVGRPNVGKSTFFNYISGRRISIVEDTPGVTRDRIYTDVEWRGRYFTIVDTGGIEPFSDEPMRKQMMYQAQLAVETADVIVFMVDAKEGVTSADTEVGEMLRKAGNAWLASVMSRMMRPTTRPAITATPEERTLRPLSPENLRFFICPPPASRPPCRGRAPDR